MAQNTQHVEEPEEAPVYTQLEAANFAKGKLRDARGGLYAGTEVHLAYRRSVLTAPVVLGGVLRHEYTCTFLFGPGHAMNFVARDDELMEFTLKPPPKSKVISSENRP